MHNLGVTYVFSTRLCALQSLCKNCPCTPRVDRHRGCLGSPIYGRFEARSLAVRAGAGFAVGHGDDTIGEIVHPLAVIS